MANYLHKNDLPADVTFDGDLAIDTETKGLNLLRDRLCVVQISDGKGDAHLVHIEANAYGKAKNLKKLLAQDDRQKIFHYARFDVAAIKQYLKMDVTNIYCTKIASKLIRTYTDRHSLKDLCKEYINIDLSKQQQCSDWGAAELSPEQIDYAASDVLYLHTIRRRLNELLKSEKRVEVAKRCFDFVPVRVELDLNGWNEVDIFHH